MVKVIYIAGCSHSGSTLLHRVLGAHSRTVTIGGSKHLPAFSRGQQLCSCGAENPHACPFWSRVDDTLAESGLRLSELCLDCSDLERSKRDNVSLYEAIQHASNAAVIIDTSRNTRRLRRLLAVPDIELMPIHLFKEPARQASSWKKQNRSLFRCIKRYWAVNLEIDKLCRQHGRYYSLSYEAFCREPERLVRDMLSMAGLEYDPGILDQWGEQALHVLGGNRMRKNTSSAIRLDEGYRQNLSAMENIFVRSTCSILHRRLRVRERDFPNGV